ncbi:MAG: transcriptional repressor [Pseudomonadota bacterium]
MCTDSGGRLTEKRRRVLELLLQSDSPLSAYEIRDAYNNSFHDSIPTMSVYRIVDFFESEDLVHKLRSNKKYVACAQIDSSHEHSPALFLVCDACTETKELEASSALIEQLTTLVDQSGYTLKKPQLELQCRCRSCSNTVAD